MISFAQQNYYIDAVLGNDANNGTSTAMPWKNLSKIYNTSFSADSTNKPKAGRVWTSQQLKYKGLIAIETAPRIYWTEY